MKTTEDAEKIGTATQILDAAQRMVQTRGYSAFSYADIADAVGIRKASIHYHFPSKASLARELVTRYRAVLRAHVARIECRVFGAGERLQCYAQLYRDILREGAPDGGCICLCGALAVDLAALPDDLRGEVCGFFEENQAWLARTLDEGRQAGTLHFVGTPEDQAQAFLAGLEGAMLLARTRRDVLLYCAVAHHLLAQMGVDVSLLTLTAG